MAATVDDQEVRYQHATTVTGIRIHHCFTPKQDGRPVLLKRVSNDEQSFEVTVIEEPGLTGGPSTHAPVSLKDCEL